MFASSSRLDLGVTVGPQKPNLGKTTLSGPLPILVDYTGVHKYRDLTDRELRNMHTVLGHYRARVREISFEGRSADFNKFFDMTNFPFPVLVCLALDFNLSPSINPSVKLKLPNTFLRGPKLSDLPHLRLLQFQHALLASVFGFLSSATALTDLSLQIDTVIGPSPETSFLVCLQGMPCLRSLNLSVSEPSKPSGSLPPPSTPQDIVPLLNLTNFGYGGRPEFLSALLVGFSAPSLQDVEFSFPGPIISPIVNLPRFITEMKEHYRTAQVYVAHNKTLSSVSFSLLTHSESTSVCEPHFKLHHPGLSPESIVQLSSALSTRLITIEELQVIFEWSAAGASKNVVPWLRVLQHFPSVRGLRLKGTGYNYMARALYQGHNESNDFVPLPVLEEIQLDENTRFRYGIQREYQLEAFLPFLSKRLEAGGHPVKVFFGN